MILSLRGGSNRPCWVRLGATLQQAGIKLQRSSTGEAGIIRSFGEPAVLALLALCLAATLSGQSAGGASESS